MRPISWSKIFLADKKQIFLVLRYKGFQLLSWLTFFRWQLSCAGIQLPSTRVLSTQSPISICQAAAKKLIIANHLWWFMLRTWSTFCWTQCKQNIGKRKLRSWMTQISWTKQCCIDENWTFLSFFTGSEQKHLKANAKRKFNLCTLHRQIIVALYDSVKYSLSLISLSLG